MENKKCHLCRNVVKGDGFIFCKMNNENFMCSNYSNECFTQEEIDDLLRCIDEGYNKTVINIVSWNCHYDIIIKKYNKIMEAAYDPQILIVQECTKNDFDFIKGIWKNKNWYNDDLNTEDSKLGVAIFSNDYEITFTEIFNRKFRYVIPYKVSKDEYVFTLFAVWINPIDKNYRKHLEDAIVYYRENNMFDENSIFIGDFNWFSNNKTIDLEQLFYPMVSCTRDTHFWNGKDTDTYYAGQHGCGIDDFCFVSNDINDKYEIDVKILNEWVEIKSKDDHWNGLSDHAPIIVELKVK